MTDFPTYGPPEVTILANCAKQFRHQEQTHLSRIGRYDDEKAKLDVRRPDHEQRFSDLDQLTDDTKIRASMAGDLAAQIELFLSTYDGMRVTRIARTAHEAIRAYDHYLGSTSIKVWDEAPAWQRESAINGVIFHLMNPKAGDEASHENWMKERLATGWTLGEVKDETLKTHPLLIPFEDLPVEQQFKDTLFRTIVHAASKN